MPNRVVVSPQADVDLDAVWTYIAKRNLNAANDMVDRITHTAQTIADSPKMGRLRPELREQLRSFPVENYLIFYVEIAGGVEIIRILHGRRKIGQRELR